MKKVRIPKGALRLVASDCHAQVLAEGEGQEPKLKMTIYSGKFIEGHWYWGKLGIELTGIKFDRSRYPVLENHWTDAKIGHMGKPKVNGNLSVDPDNFKFLKTDVSLEFQQNSKDGFPYQASMYAIPTRVERIERGSSAEVNGLTLHGPGTIWRECIFQEASVCVFGWDKKTQASIFSKEPTEIEAEFTNQNGEEVTPPEFSEELLAILDETIDEKKEVKLVKLTLEQITKDAPELLAKIQADAVQAVNAAFETEREKFTNEIADLTTENTGLSDRVSKLEKKDEIRENAFEQATLKAGAEKIWAEKLADSDLPEKRHSKIMKHVQFKDHLDADGKLDVVKFSAAVDAEIAEWNVDEADVLGGVSGGSRELNADAKNKEKLAKENAARADGLLKLAGQEKEKK